MIIFGIALSFVLLAALLGPYEQSALSRLSGLETPYLKVQFAIPPSLTDKQQLVNITRNLNIYSTLEAFPRRFRFIQYDCAQAALDAGMAITEFTSKPEKYREFTAGLAFQYSLLPYVNQLLNAEKKGYNRVVLKARARQVAEKFAFLATPGDFERNYRAVMSEAERQWQLFKDEGVGEEAAPVELQRQLIDPDPDYCRPSRDEISLALDRLNMDNVRNVRMVLQKRPRLILDPATLLFQFEGDTGAANAMRTEIYNLKQNTDDINSFSGYVDALYLEGGDLTEVIEVTRNMLQVNESRLQKLERAKVWTEKEVESVPSRETDNKARSDLVRRYKRAAQLSLEAEGDLLLERDLQWSTAQIYADDIYKALLDRSKEDPPRFAGIDDDQDLTIKDVYAFVKLAYQAYNLRTQRIPPEEFQVRQARSVLEEALAEAREERRRLEQARGGPPPSCFTEIETAAWVKRISSHLKLAEALRP